MFNDPFERSHTKTIILIVIAVIVLAVAVCAIFFYDETIGLIKGKPSASPTQATPLSTQTAQPTASPLPTPTPLPIVIEANTICTRFSMPEGYTRVDAEPSSFAYFLRNLTLKIFGQSALMHNGVPNESAPTLGVIKQHDSIPLKETQQSSDTIMYLWALYNYQNASYDNIWFNFNNTPVFKCDYATWITGMRVKTEGSVAQWYQSEDAIAGDTSINTFRYYLNIVQVYANTDSLNAQLTPKSASNLSIGDIFIVQSNLIKGEVGHPMIIVDMAVNDNTGEKIFILARGSAPATEAFVLQNTTDPEMGVWHSLNEFGSLTIGEFTYPASSIKSF